MAVPDDTVTVDRYLDSNLVLVLRARARRTAGATLPGRVLDETLERCLAAVRPRDRWPENTRFYAALRRRLAENPLRSLAAVGAVTAAAVYLGFGGTAVGWLGALLRGTT